MSRNISANARAVLALLLLAACLPVLLQRLSNLGLYWRFFGEQPEHSDLNDWLQEIKLPHDASIISGFQSYIPARFEHLYDNQWQPPTLDTLLYRNRKLPAVLIESEQMHDSYFSQEVARRGFNTPAQEKMHAQGHAFYLKLKTNSLFPYILASHGREFTDTNNLPPHTLAGYRAYVNPHAFSENILLRSEINMDRMADAKPAHTYTEWQKARPEGGIREVVFRWSQPSSLSLLHLTTFNTDAPDFVAELEDAIEGAITLPFISRSEYSATSTERFLHVSPPRYTSTLTVRLANGAHFSADSIMDIRGYAPAPCGLNTSRVSFDLKPKSPAKIPLDSWQNLVSTLPRPDAGVMLSAEAPLEFSLVPRMKLALRDLILVFDAADSASVGAECICYFDDGSQESLTGDLHRLHNPDGAYFRLECKSIKIVKNVSCRINFRDGHQHPPRLWQVSTSVEPVMP
jgi:hypothetical protein